VAEPVQLGMILPDLSKVILADSAQGHVRHLDTRNHYAVGENAHLGKRASAPGQ